VEPGERLMWDKITTIAVAKHRIIIPPSWRTGM